MAQIYRIRSTRNSHLMKIMSRHGWHHIPAKQIWNFGYDFETISDIVNSIPKPLCFAWRMLLDSMHRICSASMANSMMIQSWMYRGTSPDTANPTVVSHDWEREDLCGIIEVKLEPSTQELQSLQANSCAAAIWGMSKQDFLQRFSDCELPVPYTQLDALRAAAIDIQNHTEALTSQHIRLTFGNCNEARAVLVCWTKLKTYDSHGRITAVSMFESDLSLMLTTSRQIRVLCIRLIWPLFLFANRLEQ